MAGSENYGYNAANMLLTRGANAYTNDGNGNTLTGGGHTNTWDGENRLTQSVYNGTTTSHTYGADGLRRRTVQGTSTTDYVLDGDSAVRTLVNSVVDRTFLHGARGPEYERIGANAPVWNLYDGLGSVLGTVDATGAIVSTRKYDVYGAVRSSTGPSGSKHKFCGGLGHPSEDETGLVYMRARYMDPVTGRFASEDPERDGMNWFIYVTNSPTCLTDATGCRRGLPLSSMAWWNIGVGLAWGAMMLAVCATSREGSIGAKAMAAGAVIAFSAASIGLGIPADDSRLVQGVRAYAVIATAIVDMVAASRGATGYPGALIAIGLAGTYGLCLLGVMASIGYETLP